jgi:hypothetical protein
MTGRRVSLFGHVLHALSERSTAERAAVFFLVLASAAALAWAALPSDHGLRFAALGYGVLIGWSVNWALHDHSPPWRWR